MVLKNSTGTVANYLLLRLPGDLLFICALHKYVLLLKRSEESNNIGTARVFGGLKSIVLTLD